jgi:hypothetical protein
MLRVKEKSRMKRKIYAPVTDFERAVAKAEVSQFEQKTSYCPRKAAPRGKPLYLAWRILDEARDYFRTPIPEAFADQLAHRAEAVFAKHPFWARKASPRAGSRNVAANAGAQQQFECRRQREFILMSMRHWLAGVLARERPALFRALPESFKIGLELPKTPRSSGRESAPFNQSRFTSAVTVSRNGRRNLRPRFVHGCELLMV